MNIKFIKHQLYLVIKDRVLIDKNELLKNLLFDYILEVNQTDLRSPKQCRNILKIMENFIQNLKKKLYNHNRQRDRFEIKEASWLQSDLVILEKLDEHSIASTFNNITYQNEKKTSGRKCLEWEQSSIRTKRRKSEKMGTNHTYDELILSAIVSSRRSQCYSLCFTLNQLVSSPSQPNKVANMIKNEKPIIKLSPKEGLVLMVSAGLSQRAYQKIRITAKERNANIYPLYSDILLARKECYPDGIIFIEQSTEIKTKHHSRKDIRLHTIEDQLHYLLITSDPIISTIIISQDRSKVKTIQLSKSALELVKKSNKNTIDEIQSDNETDNEYNEYDNEDEDEENYELVTEEIDYKDVYEHNE